MSEISLDDYMKLSRYTDEHKAIFVELCARVGVTPAQVKLVKSHPMEMPFSDYWQFPVDAYEWTPRQEDDFAKWLLDYAYKNKRKLGFSYATKEMLRKKFVPFWIMNYGWKYSVPPKWLYAPGERITGGGITVKT